VTFFTDVLITFNFKQNLWYLKLHINYTSKYINLAAIRMQKLGVDGRIILRWIFRKWDGGTWAGLIWCRIGTGGGHL
jgi:hypothetical protein